MVSSLSGPLRCGTITLQQPMGVGTNKWGTSNKHSQLDIGQALEASLEAGITLLDTAQGYPTSEDCIGNLRKSIPNGEQAVIVSKFNSVQYKPAQLVPSLKTALTKCGVDALDAYLIHCPYGDFKVLAEQLAEAYHQGLARNVGVSNFHEAELREMHGLLAARGVPLVFNEIEFSLLVRAPESSGLLGVCKELGVTVLAWCPLGSGRLTEKQSVDELSDAPTLAVLREVKAIAKARGKTVAQVAINWCICKDTVPIPGARTKAQATENAGALGWRLSPEEMSKLDAVAMERNGAFQNPDAMMVFFGLSPPGCLRPCVQGLIGCFISSLSCCFPAVFKAFTP